MDKNKIRHSLAEPLLKEYGTLSRDELLMHLQAFITDLLKNNFENLCTMIYRHDVLESKFNKAIEGGTISEQAARISMLVWEREMEKVETRRNYKSQKGESSLKR